MNKKGSLFDGIVWMVIAFAVILFVVLFMYAHNVFYQELRGVDAIIGDNTTFSSIVDDTVGRANTGVGYMKYLALAIVIGMILTVIISNFMVKSHPAIAFISILGMTLLGVIISVYVSNAYEEVMQIAEFSSTFAEVTPLNFIMLNLPIFVGVVGMLGLLFLAVGITRDSGTGGGVL